MKPDFITEVDWKLLQEKYKENIEEIVKKLESHYPVQYLIGNVEFLNTVIEVDERVLIPRFETELLVAKTIEKIKKMSLQKPKILDLGTGSGCIAIALKKNINADVTGVDISDKALEVAKKNALLNQVEIQFINADMKEVSYTGYDVIISNPPYVKKTEPVGEETKFEPQNALFAKNDGLYFYEQILKKVSELSTKPKLIAFEIGMSQKEEIKKLINKYLSTSKIETEKDLAHKDRYIFIECE